MSNENHKISIYDAGVISIVRGCAFSLITAIYLYIGGSFARVIWCVYLGFLLTVSLGSDKKRLPNNVCSLLIGYAWAYIYYNSGNFVNNFLDIQIQVGTVLSELIITSSLLFLHLTVLKKTWINVIPFIFVAVATVFATGGMKNALYCFISVTIGIIMALSTQMIIEKILKEKNKRKDI